MAEKLVECPDCGEEFNHDFELASIVECPDCGQDLSLNEEGNIFIVGSDEEDDEDYDDDSDADM